MNTNQITAVAEWAPRGQLADAVRLVDGGIHPRWIERLLPFCAGGSKAASVNDRQYIGGRAEEIVKAKKLGFSYKQIESMVGSKDMHVVISFVTVYDLTPSQAMDLFRRSRKFFPIWVMRTLLEFDADYELMLQYWAAFRERELEQTVITTYLDEDHNAREVYRRFMFMSGTARGRMADLSNYRTPFGLAVYVAEMFHETVNFEIVGTLARELRDAEIEFDHGEIVEMANRLDHENLDILLCFLPYIKKGMIPFKIAFDLVVNHGRPLKNHRVVNDFMDALAREDVGLNELVDAMNTLSAQRYLSYQYMRSEGTPHEEALLRCAMGGLFDRPDGHMAKAGITLPEGLKVLLARGDMEEFVGLAGLTGVSADEYLAMRDADGD